MDVCVSATMAHRCPLPRSFMKCSHCPFLSHYSDTKRRDAQFLKFIIDKELYMFRTDLLSIIWSLNTVYTATGICHAGYVGCLLAWSGWNCCSILTSYDKYLFLCVQC